ncbi:HD domain-containing protein [uncultured Friedmanniella sp.]|uniref:HD domain-containing protein n=1 Tax=uncultured Friedmanniella sp. TaxID=335381 RepID=UPI0035CBC42D
MTGYGDGLLVRAHAGSRAELGPGPVVGRELREQRERDLLRPGATLASGAGHRAVPEAPDVERTCFERDRDRIVHSPAFRRLAGKTQVVVYPTDHQRTRLTHALEVAQVATSIARGAGVNVGLTEAIALGHDCGHGPGGHASEDAFDAFLPGGYDHGPWGADVVLTSLNLCSETLDGIRNHSWSRPAPRTVEGEIVSWADRIAYCAHDLEDAVHAGIVVAEDLPAEVVEVAGGSRREQLGTFVRAVVRGIAEHGEVGMPAAEAAALAALRAFNYERIYVRPESLAQSRAVVEVLRALVEFYAAHPGVLPIADGPAGRDDPWRASVTYVAGMTDRYAFDMAVRHLDWPVDRLPPAVDRPHNPAR